ncbi:DUF1800 domain-containing protein [Phytohabitans suffuscus]|uniref:DUF1800 domain-containing protein n=1 Tax=Phytohabitans suffuscus TaxID=624315 RepID=UPI001E4CCC2F|nr:DUF1800 domain-containing protein [Phytohabitans suffuscus]
MKAGARALTGWTVDRATGTAAFVPRRHDPGAADHPGRDGGVRRAVAGGAAVPAAGGAHVSWRGGCGSASPARRCRRRRTCPARPPYRRCGPPSPTPAFTHPAFARTAFTRTVGQHVKEPVD